MVETPDFQLDQEIRQLEVETFEIEDLVDAEQTAGAFSCSTTSATTSCTSTVSCSC